MAEHLDHAARRDAHLPPRDRPVPVGLERRDAPAQIAHEVAVRGRCPPQLGRHERRCRGERRRANLLGRGLSAAAVVRHADHPSSAAERATCSTPPTSWAQPTEQHETSGCADRGCRIAPPPRMNLSGARIAPRDHSIRAPATEPRRAAAGDNKRSSTSSRPRDDLFARRPPRSNLRALTRSGPPGKREPDGPPRAERQRPMEVVSLVVDLW